MRKLLVSLATYNEKENLSIIVPEIFLWAPDADILVIDDNSPDGTGDWVEENMKGEPRLKLIRRSGKLGLGTAVLTGMKYAIENDYDYFLNMDADLSHSPEYIPDILKKTAEGFDVVIGSRYVSGGGSKAWPLHRKIMSRAINAYTRFFFGLKTKDNSGSFRCYSVDSLKILAPDSIISKGYSFFEEVLYRLKKVGASFAEVPIIFVERRFGTSKINKKETLLALWLIFRIGVFGK